MEYLLLAGSGLTAAVHVITHTEHRARALAVLATAASVVMLADWICYGWFHLYTYRTHLVSTPQADNALGELLADIIFVPGLSLLLARYLPNAWGVALGTLIVSLLQVWFHWLGLFEHRGWTVWYTAASFPFYFGGLTYYWRRLDNQEIVSGWPSKQLRLAIVFNAVALLSLFYRGQALVVTNIHVMPTYEGNQALGRFLWYALVTVPIGYWVLSRDGVARWRWLGAAFAVFFILNLWLPAAGIQYFVRYWSGPLDALAQTMVILAAAWAQDRLYALAESEAGWNPPVLPRGR